VAFSELSSLKSTYELLSQITMNFTYMSLTLPGINADILCVANLNLLICHYCLYRSNFCGHDIFLLWMCYRLSVTVQAPVMMLHLQRVAPWLVMLYFCTVCTWFISKCEVSHGICPVPKKKKQISAFSIPELFCAM